MCRSLLATVVIAGTIGIAAAQTRAADNSNTASELTGGQQHQFSKSVSSSSTDGVSPQAFEGTWQGVWRRYRAASHTEEGSQTSLSVALRGKRQPMAYSRVRSRRANFSTNPRQSRIHRSGSGHHRAPSRPRCQRRRPRESC